MCAAEALRRALAHVEFIILLMADSPISDLPHRWAWRKRFVEHIRRDPLGHKLHVFVLRDPATGGIGPHTYVHAKTMMVDDELSIIGSANCNRRGWESDTEVAAAIAGDADASGRLFAGRIRQRLWAEHLGVATSVVEDLSSAHHYGGSRRQGPPERSFSLAGEPSTSQVDESDRTTSMQIPTACPTGPSLTTGSTPQRLCPAHPADLAVCCPWPRHSNHLWQRQGHRHRPSDSPWADPDASSSRL
jgi:hypothetical protein